jgi:ABC-type multidrug transport system fused ATPase/permease subunit
VGTMQNTQFLEITQFFISPGATMSQLRMMIVNFIMTRLLAIAVERVNSKISEYGQRAFSNSLTKAVYEKLVGQDMSYFETKFTKPREANSMLLRQTRALVRIVNMLLRTLGSASGICTTAILL